MTRGAVQSALRVFIATMLWLGVGAAVAQAQPVEPGPVATPEGEGGEEPEAPPGDVPPPAPEGEVAAPGDGGAETTPDIPVPAAPRRRLIVIDAASYGIDPVVGRHVSRQMRATGAALGYDVLTPEQSVAAAQRLRMPYPPTPANLWRVSYVAQAQRGAFARVWAHSGSYVVEITVASLDGTGPFFTRGNAGAGDLHAVVDRLTREALPPPEVWREDTQGAGSTQPGPVAPGQVGAGGVQPDAGSGEAGTGPAAAPGGEFADEAGPEPRRRRRRRRPRRRIHLALQTEGAIGTSQDSFYNHLIGLRLDYRVSREILFGAYAAYANLRGKDGRTSNLLMYLQIEDRVRISSSSDITIPLRLAIGYLPYNGPVVRLAAGLNIPLNSDLQLGFDILTPTFWVLPDRTAVSLNLGAELIWRL